MSWGVVSILVSKLSKFVFSGVNTGVGENSHLSSLRNAWGECIGVDGGVFSPSSKNSSGLSGDGSNGIKGSLSLKNTVLLFSLSNSILFCKLSMLYMSCISKTACFLVNCASLFPPVWTERGAKTARSCLVHQSSIIANRTPPAMTNRAQFGA